MNILNEIVTQYPALCVGVVVGAAYVVTHRQAALSYAKRRAWSLMLAAEKRAESLGLADGMSRFDWVVSKGYDMLPSPVRLFVSKPLFASVVQTLFDDAVAFAKAHEAPVTSAASSTPVTADASVASTTSVTQ